MSTPDQKLASEIHGTALLLAQDERLQPLLEQLAQATADVMTFEPKRPASWRAAGLLNRADISATSSSPPGYSFSLASPTATSSRRQCGLASNAAGDHCRPQWASSSRAPREPGSSTAIALCPATTMMPSGSVRTPRVVASQPHSTSRSRALPRGSP